MDDIEFTMSRIESIIKTYASRVQASAHSDGYDEGFQASSQTQFDSGYNEALSSIEDAGLCYEDGYAAAIEENQKAYDKGYAAALDKNQKSYDKGYADGVASAQVAEDIIAINESYDQGFADGVEEGLEQTSQAGFDYGWDCAMEQMMGISKP